MAAAMTVGAGSGTDGRQLTDPARIRKMFACLERHGREPPRLQHGHPGTLQVHAGDEGPFPEGGDAGDPDGSFAGMDSQP